MVVLTQVKKSIWILKKIEIADCPCCHRVGTETTFPPPHNGVYLLPQAQHYRL